jgi:hypothetical protein
VFRQDTRVGGLLEIEAVAEELRFDHATPKKLIWREVYPKINFELAWDPRHEWR